MKIQYIALAALSAVLTSCATQPAPPPPSGCCAKKAGPVALPPSCSGGPMSPVCGGNCSPQDCRCKPQRCTCSKPKPKPAPVKKVYVPPPPKPVVVVPAPLPPPPPQKKVVVEENQRYRWEFANPANRVYVDPTQPTPPTVAPEPASDGFWMRGSYRETEVLVPAGTR